MKYDSEVKNAYVQYIMNGSDYNNLNRYKQAKLRVAEILFQLQTTAKLPGPRKKNHMQFIGGLNQEIEQFMIQQQKLLLTDGVHAKPEYTTKVHREFINGHICHHF